MPFLYDKKQPKKEALQSSSSQEEAGERDNESSRSSTLRKWIGRKLKTSTIQDKLAAGDASVFKGRGYLGSQENQPVDIPFEYTRNDSVQSRLPSSVFNMDAIAEGGNMQGIISVAKGNTLSSNTALGVIGKWDAKTNPGDKVDFISVDNGASGTAAIKIPLKQIKEGRPVILSSGKLSGCTMVYAVDNDYCYAYHVGQKAGDAKWLTSREGIESIYQAHMQLKGAPVAGEMQSNNDLLRIFSTYDSATINYFGKETKVTGDTHISDSAGSNLNVFDYNAAVDKKNRVRLAVSYALLSRNNGQVNVSTYSDDMGIALKDKKVTSLSTQKNDLT